MKYKKLAFLHGVSSYPLLPNFTKEMANIHKSIDYEYCKTENVIGREKAKELLNRFKNESFSQGSINSEYIIDKLREARTN